MKKLMRRISVLLLILALLLPAAAMAAGTVTFTDVSETFWGYEAIRRCADAGIVNGIGHDLFAPDSTLTYAQYYVILCRALFADQVAAQQAADDGWYDAQTRYLMENLYLRYPVDDHPDRDYSTTGMNSGISRYEMALTMYNIAKNAGDYPATAAAVPTDLDVLPECYATPVVYCYQRGLLTGYKDGAFHGEDTVTRAQACTVVCRLMDYLTENGYTPAQPDGEIDPADITAAIYAFQSDFPEGMRWTNETEYYSTTYYPRTTFIGYGCVAFALVISDSIFGSATVVREYTDFDSIRVGDIIRMNGDSHSAIVTEKYDDHIVIAEGGYNASVHWGRVLYRNELDLTYGETRY